MSTMVNLGIGFQEPLTPQHGGCTNSRLLEGDVKVRKCHVMLFLRTCMSGNGCDLTNSFRPKKKSR